MATVLASWASTQRCDALWKCSVLSVDDCEAGQASVPKVLKGFHTCSHPESHFKGKQVLLSADSTDASRRDLLRIYLVPGDVQSMPPASS